MSTQVPEIVQEIVQGGQVTETPAVAVEGGATEVIVAEPVQGGAIEAGGYKKGSSAAKRMMAKARAARKHHSKSHKKSKTSKKRSVRAKVIRGSPRCPGSKVLHVTGSVSKGTKRYNCVSRFSRALPKSQRRCKHDKVRASNGRCYKPHRLSAAARKHGLRGGATVTATETTTVE